MLRRIATGTKYPTSSGVRLLTALRVSVYFRCAVERELRSRHNNIGCSCRFPNWDWKVDTAQDI